MRNYLSLFAFLLFTTTACKQKEEEKKNFISIVSLIKSQVAQVDTSLFSIMKFVYTDSLHIDTSYIPREEFAAAAKEFLSVPDLSDKKVAKRFTEEPARYDEMMNRVIFTYLPIKPDKEEIKKQELLVTPVPGEESIVNSIYIVREISNRDSFLQQKMLWLTGKSFEITTRSQKPGKPETSFSTKVVWNEGMIP